MMKWLLSFLIVLLLFMGIVVAALLTPAGFKIGMYVAQKSLPGELHYKKISGLIIGPINASDITYRYQGTVISIKRLHIQWRLSQLLAGKIAISQLNADYVNILLPQKKGKRTNFTLPSIKLHFAFSIDHGIINHINIGNHPNQYSFQLRSLTFNANLGDQHNQSTLLNANVQANFVKPYPVSTLLSIDGTTEHYQFKLIAQGKQFHWRMNGTGGKNWVQVTTHQAQTLQGYLNGDVKLTFSPQWRWKATIDAHHLNLKEINPNWPKQLNLQLTSQGYWQEKQPMFTLNSRIQTPGVLIQAQGKHDQRWNLAWTINANQLSNLFAKWHGSLRGHGKIIGSTRTPTISGQLSGQKVLLHGYSIADFDAQWDVDSSYQQPSDIELTAKDINANHIHLTQLQLDAKGRPNSQQISGLITLGNTSSGLTQINLLLNGQLINHQWHGQLKRFDIQSRLLGQWRLRNTAQLTITPHQITTTPICWNATRGNACLRGRWSATDTWQASLTGKGINITPLFALSKKNLSIHSPAVIALNVNGNGKNISQATGSIKFGKGIIRHTIDKETIRIKFNSGTINTTLNKTGLNAALHLNLSAVNTINASINLPNFSPLKQWNPKQPLRGNITIDTNNLKLISALVPDISKPTGRLKVTLNGSGTLAHPTIGGHIELQNGSAQITPLQVTLTHISIDLHTVGSTVSYTHLCPLKNKFF